MADAGNDGKAATPAAGPPNLSVVAQYVKDFSFESPGAPQSLGPRSSPPSINIAIGVQSSQIADNRYEVELRIDARAAEGDAVIFNVELVYAGIFQFTNIPAEQLKLVALIQCPTLLFPFARQIIAEATRNGSFPPLLIDPVDFVQIYRQQQQGEVASQPRPTLS